METDNQTITSSDGGGGPKYYRDYDQLDDDFLLLTMNEDSKGSRRYVAVIEVLRRLPDDDYGTLVDGNDTFDVFVPHEQVHGMVMPFFSKFQEAPLSHGGQEINFKISPRVMYLSPWLEKAAWDILVAVVAHEFAHLILGHRLSGLPKEIEQRQESEVDEYLQSRGFEKEEKKCTAYFKRRTTLEARKEIALRSRSFLSGGLSLY